MTETTKNEVVRANFFFFVRKIHFTGEQESYYEYKIENRYEKYRELKDTCGIITQRNYNFQVINKQRLYAWRNAEVIAT